jgi:hypothetical protein
MKTNFFIQYLFLFAVVASQVFTSSCSEQKQLVYSYQQAIDFVDQMWDAENELIKIKWKQDERSALSELTRLQDYATYEAAHSHFQAADMALKRKYEQLNEQVVSIINRPGWSEKKKIKAINDLLWPNAQDLIINLDSGVK